jgi:multidrug efflux pump subunit AcrA (membrane-fusion protein)
MKKKIIAGSSVLALASIVTPLFVSMSTGQEQPVAEPILAPSAYTLEQTATLPIQVAGIVHSTDTVIVRAETAGRIERILVSEGDTVGDNTLLSSLDSSVLSSQIQLQDAINTLQTLTQEAQEARTLSQAEIQTVHTQEARTQLNLQTDSNKKRIQEASVLLESSLEQSALTLITVLDFVDANRSLFPSESMTLYTQVLDSLYDTLPDSLRSKLVQTSSSKNTLLVLINNLRDDAVYNETTLLELSTHIDKVLSDTIQIYTLAESHFLDEKRLSISDVRYVAYLSHRSTIISTQSDVRTAVSSLQTYIDTASIQQDTLTGSNDTQLIEERFSKIQNELSTKSTQQQKYVGEKQLSALYSQQALSETYSPFSGLISEVYVELGEYVSPGTPLFRIVGTEAHELKVTIPTKFVSLLKKGQPFVEDTTPVGFVDRFAPEATNGYVEVFISLTQTTHTIGETLKGTISLESTDNSITIVPRTHMFFDSQGAYVVTTENSEHRFTILYDAGNTLYGTLPKQPENTSLIPSTSINV